MVPSVRFVQLWPRFAWQRCQIIYVVNCRIRLCLHLFILFGFLRTFHTFPTTTVLKACFLLILLADWTLTLAFLPALAHLQRILSAEHHFLVWFLVIEKRKYFNILRSHTHPKASCFCFKKTKTQIPWVGFPPMEIPRNLDADTWELQEPHHRDHVPLTFPWHGKPRVQGAGGLKRSQAYTAALLVCCLVLVKCLV